MTFWTSAADATIKATGPGVTNLTPKTHVQSFVYERPSPRLAWSSGVLGTIDDLFERSKASNFKDQGHRMDRISAHAASGFGLERETFVTGCLVEARNSTSDFRRTPVVQDQPITRGICPFVSAC